MATKPLIDVRTEAETRAKFILDEGIDLVQRRLYAGAKSAEHNPDFDVGFMLARDIATGLHTLQTQFRPNKAMNEDENKPIEIFLSTFGGDLYSAFGIYDLLRVSPVPIHVYVFGQCMSAGTVIMQGAEKRFVSKSSRLMIHYGSTTDEGTSNPVRVDEVWKEHREIMDEMVEIYMTRCNKELLAERRAKKVLEEFSKGWPMSNRKKKQYMQNYNVEALAEEALRKDILPIESYFVAKRFVELGLADEIVTKPPPKKDPFAPIVADEASSG